MTTMTTMIMMTIVTIAMIVVVIACLVQECMPVFIVVLVMVTAVQLLVLGPDIFLFSGMHTDQ